MGGFEILEHTGEVGIIARGEDLKQAFANAAMGLFSVMVEGDTISSQEWRDVEVEAPDVEALLVAWLNELLYLFDVEHLLLKDFEIRELEFEKGDRSPEAKGARLKARVYGERFHPERHSIQVGVKSATYHMLEVRRDEEGEGWRVQVILDV